VHERTHLSFGLREASASERTSSGVAIRSRGTRRR
jgi:hypothetical protein